MPNLPTLAEQVFKSAVEKYKTFTSTSEGWNDTSRDLWSFIKDEIALALQQVRRETWEEAANLIREHQVHDWKNADTCWFVDEFRRRAQEPTP